MKNLSRESSRVNETLPPRILQFGGGNFLRGFVDWIIHKYNVQSNDDKLGIIAVKVRKEGSYQKWKDQDGLFHLFTKGYAKGKTVDKVTLVKSVTQVLEAHRDYEGFLLSSHIPSLNIIVSNTTEAGIRFDPEDKFAQTASTFPGQLSQWLIERFRHFEGDSRAGCTLIPCELLDQNGQVLKKALLSYAEHWGIEASYSEWLVDSCRFCNTLVDRIVPGVKVEKREEYWERISLIDTMMTEGEPYHLWAIESDQDIGAKLPLDRIGLNVFYTKDLTPFKELKLKILNGAHTSMVPLGILLGLKHVREAVEHEVLGNFLQTLIFKEVIPSLGIVEAEARSFANDVFDRFQNPFLDHQLEAISLYSVSKFNARIKPSLKAYYKKERSLPKNLLLTFACLLVFYKGSYLGSEIKLNDRNETIQRIQDHWKKIETAGAISEEHLVGLLADEELWSEDLNQIKGLSKALAIDLGNILNGKLEDQLK